MKRPLEPDSPECDKWAACSDGRQTVADFLDFLSEKGISLAVDSTEHSDAQMPCNRSRSSLIAEFFEIDVNRLEDERRALLSWMSELNTI